MLFIVGIESPKSDKKAFGIVVPVFEKLGFGCVSATDNRQDILRRAKEVILDMLEVLIENGHLISSLGEDFEDYRAKYPEFDEWIAMEIPVKGLTAKSKRINITLPETLLRRVDAYVSTHLEYKDRSDFLAKSADRMMLLKK